MIRSSICTGERVACMRERATGRLHELMLIRSEEDIAAFCRRYRVEETDLKTVY
ncbi:MAG: aspartate dehydrogenase [Oscillospiraceae bacterium]|nr:aspartate dehydrogenase [Oscillospiraceae bacterium]